MKKYLRYNIKKTSGFTLIELLVVVAIIGVLATIIVASLSRARNKAIDVRYLKHAKELQKSIEIFNLDNNRYPDSGDEATALTGEATASNCSNMLAVNQRNWDDFVADMGDYLPDFFAQDGAARPECYFFTSDSVDPASSPHVICPSAANKEYVLTFGTVETEYEGIEYFTDGFGDTYHCLYNIK